MPSSNKVRKVTSENYPTDAGREGELIFRLVYEQTKCKKPVSRLWLSSMEDNAIREGFANLRPSTEYDALYQAALCRERADWEVGINCSRLFSCLYGRPLAVGRVMTPTLAMAVQREAAISAFTPEKFYTVLLAFVGGGTASSKRFSQKADAERLLTRCRKEVQTTVQKVERKEKAEKPPQLYDLTTLQRDANRLLGFTAQQTLNYETSFVYVKGDFEPIVSEALWHECERIRKSRISSLRLPDGETRRKGARTTKNLWVAKLRCRCGSSYRIFNWRKLKDGTPVFGYQCNMRTVNPTRSFVMEHNLTDQLSCDAISIPEWKLELMAKKIFEKVWGDQNKAILRACQMLESCQNSHSTAAMSAVPIQSKIEKIKKRKLNYGAMRADGELEREEYQALCKQADDEIARLEKELQALTPAPETQSVSTNMKAIRDFLEQKVDVHGACLAPELIDQFVEVVTPIGDYTYRWKLNTGRKKSKDERTDLMAVTDSPILAFTIDFETAKRYREANKMPHQFRRAAWTDLTVEVYL